MFKYIVFDFDGTLADSRSVFVRAYNQVADKHQFRRVEPGLVEELRQLPLRRRFAFLRIPFYKIPFIAPQFFAAYRALLPEVTLIDGVRELLRALRTGGYRLAIISSNSESIIRDFLAAHALDDDFQAIVCSQNLFGKDRSIRTFLRRHGLTPADMLYVGDEQRDVEACRRAGVKVVWVSWGYDRRDGLGPELPDAVIDAPAELLGLLTP